MRILAAIPLSYDATSYYRSMGIFANLRRNHMPELIVENYIGAGRRTWAELINFDILFLQRPSHPDWLKLAQYCKSLKMKIWIDHDDNLFQLPPYNRVYDTYTPQIKKTMLDILKLADLVTVSTGGIKKQFDSLGVQNVNIVPNAINEEITPMAKEWNSNPRDHFLWRGSETHWNDLLEFSVPIIDAMSERNNTMWTFMGFNPTFITLQFPQEKWQYFIPEDPMVYFENLRNAKPSIMFTPLFGDGLNGCKSNIAWIEGTAAGAVNIAPNWPEWQKPGIMNYSSIIEFFKWMVSPLDGAKERWEQSRDYILENLTLTHVNKQRKQLIENLWH